MSKNMMTLLVESPGVFPLVVEIEGQKHKVYSCSVRDEMQLGDRFRYLMRELIEELDLDAEQLNKIGFSDEDAGELSMHIDGLKHSKPPHWEL